MKEQRMRVRYFDDIEFLGAAVQEHCTAVLDRSFPGTYSVEFMLSGRMRLGVDHGPSVVLCRPTVFWHHPRHSYQYGAVDRSGWHHHWVLFRGARGRRLLERGFMPLSPAGCVRVEQPGLVADLFHALVSSVEQGTVGGWRRALLLMERLLCHLLDTTGEPAPGDGARGRVAAEVEAVNATPLQGHDPREAARRLHLSHSHYRRLFRRQAGMPPHAFLLACRMRAAARMLHAPGVSVKQVAAALGYEDPAQFSKAFKQRMGFSPRQYRSMLPV